MIRKEKLFNGGVYHIFNKSIAGFKIFNHDFEYQQMLRAIKYYQLKSRPLKLSDLERCKECKALSIDNIIDDLLENSERQVNILNFCLMPTHYHLTLEQTAENGISNFIRQMQNSYTKFFNNLHKRKGPLWQGPFQNRFIDNDYVLLHISRYIHLNPCTSYLVKKPDQWDYGSYNTYINKNDYGICNYRHLIDSTSDTYIDFCKNQIEYQRDLKAIKNYILE